MVILNPWRQYILLILGAIAGTACYLLSDKYGLADMRTAVTEGLNLYRQRTYIRVPVLLALLLMVLALLLSLLCGLIRHVRRTDEPQNYVSAEEYRRQTAELTKREVERLVNSEEFKAAARSRGNDPLKWNWQASERKFREAAYKKEMEEQRAARSDSVS